MARSNSPRAAARRRVLNDLAAAKRKITQLQGWWSDAGAVYEPHPDGPSRMGTRRDRRPEEYPEAKRHYWASTVNELDEVIEQLTKLRESAYAEYQTTPTTEA